MSVKLGRLRLKIGFFAAACTALLLARGPWRLPALSGAAVLLHELTHLLCMRRCGCLTPTVQAFPGGIKIHSDDFETLDCPHAVLCLASAPAVNLLLGGVLLAAVPKDMTWTRFFAAANLAMGAVNCLPLSFLDGGQTLGRLLLAFRGAETAARLQKQCDWLCLLLMIAAAVPLALRGIFPLPYYLFCLYCLVAAGTKHSQGNAAPPY